MAIGIAGKIFAQVSDKSGLAYILIGSIFLSIGICAVIAVALVMAVLRVLRVKKQEEEAVKVK